MRIPYRILLLAFSLAAAPVLLAAQEQEGMHADTGQSTDGASARQEQDDDSYFLGSGHDGSWSPGYGPHGMMEMMGPGMMGMMGGFGPGMMGGWGGFGTMGFDPIEMLRGRLGLSDDQVSRVRQLWLEHIRSSAPAQANLRVASAELQALLSAQQPNMQQIEQKVRQIQQITGDHMLAGIRSIQQFRSILTAQQRSRLQGMTGWGPAGSGMLEWGGMMGPGMMGPGGSGFGRTPWWYRERENDD